MRTYRVVVADDDPTFRSAAVEVLEADDRFVVVGELGTGAGLADLVEQTGADVVLLDVRVPGGGACRRPAARRALRSPGGDDRGVRPGRDRHGVPDAARRHHRLPAQGRLGASMPDLVARCADGELVLAVPTGGAALHQFLGSLSRPGC